MIRRHLRLISLLAAVVLLGILFAWWKSRGASVLLVDGSRLTCRSVDVGTNTPASLRADSFFSRAAQRLPNFLRRLTPSRDRLTFPDGTNLIFWLELNRPIRVRNQFQFTVGDGRGPFLPILFPITGSPVEGRTSIVLPTRVWPRRAEEFTIQIFDTTLSTPSQLAGELKIPNPFSKKFPEWKPNPLPIVSQLEGAEIVLERFEIRPMPVMLRQLSRTNLVEPVAYIQIRRSDAEAWTLEQIQMVDATGNEWLVPQTQNSDGKTLRIFGGKIPGAAEPVLRLETFWRSRITGTAPSVVRQLTFTVRPTRLNSSLPLRDIPEP
jgi:hypothetical protein